MIYDVIIIGAGVIGCAVARELARYHADILVLEKDGDVCTGTSKANSAIIHSGYDAESGSLKAQLNVRGNEMMDTLCEELDIPFMRIGSLTVCTDEEKVPLLHELFERGVTNGVKGLRILNREETLAIEPHIGDEVVASLYAPTAGIIWPFRLTAAMAENACENGVEFRFHAKVEKIFHIDGVWHVVTSDGEYLTETVVNAAGVYADELNNMVSDEKLVITPRRGDYLLLDNAVAGYVRHTVFQLPTKLGKGILVTPTVHGNIIVGPTAVDIVDKENTATTAEGLDEILSKSKISIKDLPTREVITSFAGLRACEDGHDFILGEAKGADGFYNCAGIQSPGLSASPAIGEYIAEMIRKKLSLTKKDNFKATNKDIIRTKDLEIDERASLIRENPAYGTIICRCESISEGEIIDAIHRPLGARTLDGIKRRTGAQLGRCQGGFCIPKIMEILARETGMAMEEITKCGGDSYLVCGRTKDGDKGC